MGMGAVVLGIAVLSVLAWAAYLAARSRVRRRIEKAPLNQTPYLDDRTLENVRLNRVLFSALAASTILAILLPVYYLNEQGRQEHATERLDEIAAERGHEWYQEFKCGDCHGPSGGGGGADYVEDRSGLTTSWAAPSIDDVLYRYSEEEVRFWLVYGRPGTPMPAWGTDGGGPLNSQQIDELIVHLSEIAVPQADLVAQVDARVDLALSRLAGADDTVAGLIERQRAEIAALEAAPSQLDAIGGAPGRLETLLTADGTCTEASALLYLAPCESPGADTDGDGLSDAAEVGLGALLAEVVATAPASDPVLILEPMAFDPAAAYTTDDGGTPVPDLDQVERAIAEIDLIVRNLDLAVANNEKLTAAALDGLAFLEDAAAARRWSFDFHALAPAFDGDTDRAQRAVGLFNAYCARCHTAGYSAGVAFTMEAGSGAFGPSLRGGRSVVQFPDIADQVAFLVDGSENGVQYGVNGVGRGWMPGFGSSLSQDDLELLATLVRSLP
ncbi:MAG: cytochrome c [Actinobacteria bacterium]|nr:cytochrome c [Actinomycetota bacterium]